MGGKRELNKRSNQGPLGMLATGALLTSGAWILYSNLLIDHELHLPNAIPAEREDYYSKEFGKISYYSDRKVAGRPLVLVHSINAAASAYEMRPLFEHYRTRRPVYALDWPGYGFSERTPRQYDPQFFENVLIEFLSAVVGEPVDLVALSLGAEFAARAALGRPDLFQSLALISPSGLSVRGEEAGTPTRDSSPGDIILKALSFPLWSQALFDLVATQRIIEFYLRRSFVGPVTPGFSEYAYLSSHQPGARYVPLYFLSGKLFTPNIADTIYQQLETPALVIYDQDQYINFEKLPQLLESNPNWQAVRIAPTLGLPQFEKLQETTAALDAFWQARQ